MSLTTIPYQPFVFGHELDICTYCDDQEYCQLVEPDDYIYIQFLQSPCGENLICDATFERISADLVTNGTFTGSAASWTLGVAWSYAANIVSFAGGPGHGQLYQTIATALVNGKYYLLRFTVSNVTGTLSLRARLGGGTYGNTVSAAGTFTVTLKSGNATNDLLFDQAIDTCTFDIDNIELYEIAPCWDAANDWHQTESQGLYHEPGASDSIYVATPPLTNGVRYYVAWQMENVTAGSIQVMCGTQVSDIEADADGYWYDWVTANGADFAFKPTADFDGYITFVEVKAMNDDYEIVLSDIVAATDYMPAISDADYYYHEFLTFRFKLSDYQATYGFADESCFRLTIVDQCDDYSQNLVTNSFFVDGFDDWVNGANWFTSFRSCYVLAAYNSNIYQYKYDEQGDPIIRTETKYKYHIKVTGAFPATTDMVVYTGSRTLVTITAPGTYEGEVTVAAPLNHAVFQIGFHGDGISTTTRIYVTEIELYAITEVDETLISNCIKYAPDHECTRLVQAYADGEERAWGFEYYNTGFILSQRLELSIGQPSYPDEEENYQYSDGTRSVNYASSEKYLKCGTYFLPEEAHDCLRLQRLSDHFLIDSVEYYSKKGGHSPVWKDQCQSLAPVQFDIRLKTDPTYNRNGI